MIFCFLILRCWSLPQNPQILSGEVRFENDSNQLFIYPSPNAVIEWDDFSIDFGERVEFIQSESTDRVENRVLGAPSRLGGDLVGRGSILLINPKGISLARTSELEVGTFIASTLHLEDGKFSERSKGAIFNQGKISGNQVELIGYEVQNFGKISAQRIGLIGAREVKVTDGAINTNYFFENEEESSLHRFDSLHVFDMPGPLVINRGRLSGDKIYILGDYIDLRPSSRIVGRMIFIGGGEEGLKNGRIVKINGKIVGERTTIWSDAAILGRGKIKGESSIKAPYLKDIDD